MTQLVNSRICNNDLSVHPHTLIEPVCGHWHYARYHQSFFTIKGSELAVSPTTLGRITKLWNGSMSRVNRNANRRRSVVIRHCMNRLASNQCSSFPVCVCRAHTLISVVAKVLPMHDRGLDATIRERNDRCHLSECDAYPMLKARSSCPFRRPVF